MNNNHKRIVGLLIFCLFGLNILFLPQVNAETYYEICDFDNIPAGSTSLVYNVEKVNDFMLLKNVSTDGNFKIASDHYVSAYSCLKVGVGSDAKGYLNLSTSFSYVSLINISLYMADLTTESTRIQFYDEDDNMLINFKCQSNELLAWYDDTGWETVFDALPSTWYYIHIEHLYTNMFNISLWDGGVRQGYIVKPNCYSDTWTTFDYIIIECDDTTYIEIDDIKINTSGYSDQFDFCLDNEFKVIKEFDNSVLYMNETGKFHVTNSVGLPFYYKIQNSTTVVQDGYSNSPIKDIYYTTNIDDGYGTYYFYARQFGGTIWYLACPFTIIQTENPDKVTSLDLVIYKTSKNCIGGNYVVPNDIYYDLFVAIDDEIIEYDDDGWVKRRISIDQKYSPFELEEIVLNKADYYYMVKIQNNSNSSDFVIDTIYNGEIITFGELWVDGKLYGEVNKKVGQIVKIEYLVSLDLIGWNIYLTTNLSSISSGVVGSYPITSSNGVYNYKIESDYVNETIYVVFQSGNQYLTYMGYCEINVLWSDAYTEYEQVTSFNILLGLAISLGIGIGCLILTHEIIVFPIVSGTTAFILSRPEMGNYFLLPEIIGVGLIAILVLIAFISWISS